MAEREPRTVFGGRLGTYRYMDMHQAIGAALNAVDAEVMPLLKQFGHFWPKRHNRYELAPDRERTFGIG